jgi:hypothetical protein
MFILFLCIKTINCLIRINFLNFIYNHFIIIELEEYLNSYGMFIRSEKLEQIKKECQFGQSRISKILIGLIVVMVFMSSFIGFTIGHCIIKAYKK